MLRFSVPIIPHIIPHRIVEVLYVEWRNSTPRFSPIPQRENENIKYFIPSSGNRIYNRRVYSRTYVLLRFHDSVLQYNSISKTTYLRLILRYHMFQTEIKGYITGPLWHKLMRLIVQNSYKKYD